MFQLDGNETFGLFDNSTVGEFDNDRNGDIIQTCQHSGSVNFKCKNCKNESKTTMCQLDGNETFGLFDNPTVGEYDTFQVPNVIIDKNGDIIQTCQHSGSVNFQCENCKNGSKTTMCQLDGNETLDSMSSYDSEEELECEPIRAVLVPSPQLAGQPFTLDVDDSEDIAAPSSLPLTMVANFRSAYNKIKSIKQNLHVLGLDFLVASESWERPHYDLNRLLDSPNYVCFILL